MAQTLHARTQEILAGMGRGAVKLRGQHFLIDGRVLEKIVEASGVSAGDRVLEIGPGLGFLTELLLAKGCVVVAVELDPGFGDYLETHFAEAIASGKFTLIRGSALEVDLRGIFKGASYKVVANIPYNISAPLLEKFVLEGGTMQSATLLVQKEVAERVCVKTPDMNMQALLVQSVFAPKVGFTVPAGAFSPPPKVTSAILRLEMRADQTSGDLEWLKVAKRAFSGPRKKIINTLGLEKAALLQLGLSGEERPAELTANDWRKLFVFMRSLRAS